MYDHTRIASYRHWGARSAGILRVRLLALDGKSAKLAGGLPSGPILSRLRRSEGLQIQHFSSICMHLLKRINTKRQKCETLSAGEEGGGPSEFFNFIYSNVADQQVFGPPGSGSGSTSTRYGSFYDQAKIVRKTLILFCDFFKIFYL